MIVKVEAVVLSRRPFRDTSLIATLLTREYGKMSVVAKGAREPKGKMAAAFQPMNLVTAVVYRKEHRDLQLVTQCDLRRQMKYLQSDLARMEAGLAVVELTSAATHGAEEHVRLYDLVARTLEVVDGAEKRPRNALYVFELRLLDLLGVCPDFGRCPRCGNTVESVPEGGGTLLDTGRGVLCHHCSREAVGIADMTIQVLKVLQYLQKAGDPEAALNLDMPAPLEERVAAALRRTLHHHLEWLSPLRSQRVFESLRGGM
jgi:DNA repair protein RecO (recombination protein O)